MSSVSSSKVAIVVLNRNGLRWLPKCLSGVTRTDSPNLDVYLVDNASTDESVRYVREHFPHVKIISHSTNLGFAAGYNRALEGIKADYVVLLNNDTEVLSPDWVQSLVHIAAADPKIAAVGCKMISMDQPDRLDSVGGMGIPFWRGFVDIGREERDDGQYDTTDFEPFSFCGGAALLKKAVFEQAGGFDEKFFMYVEDVDLSWRFRLLGYHVRLAPEAKVAHFFSGSSGIKTVDARKLYYCHRNLLRAILKNCGASLTWALRNYVLFWLITVVGFAILEPRKAVAVMKAFLWNLLNLKDTYRHRLVIQSTRKDSDTEILARMYPSISRHQPHDHPKSRRILNTLFEQVPTKELDGLRAELRSAHEGLGFRLVQSYTRTIHRILPDGSRRGELWKVLAESAQILVKEGLRAYIRQVREKIARGEYGIREKIAALSAQDAFEAWLSQNALSQTKIEKIRSQIEGFRYKPIISVLIPVYDTDERWLTQAIESVTNQLYENWELCIVDDASTASHVRRILEGYKARNSRVRIAFNNTNLGISATTNAALDLATGEFVCFLDHDDFITPDALFEVVSLLNQNRGLDYIYSDEDKIDSLGRRVEPFFKPDWSPELLMSMNYTCHLSVVRKTLVDQVAGFRSEYDGAQDYDLILRVTKVTDKIAHIPKPLYSWRKAPGSEALESGRSKAYAHERAKRAVQDALRRNSVNASVIDSYGGYFRTKYLLKGNPVVSIIIIAHDKVRYLRRCIQSIEKRSTYKNYEIIIVDHASRESETWEFLQDQKHRTLRYEGAFNFSKLNNFAAGHANGDHLLFLNKDTEVISPDWIEAMLEHSQRSDIGTVGALLLYPPRRSNGLVTIQHAGIIVGIGSVAGHAFKGLPFADNNYFNLHRLVQNRSAVTAACLMVRRDVFQEAGGFDERILVSFSDVDFCLRVRGLGYRVVYTPHAMLYHHEGVAKASDNPPTGDEVYVTNRWAHMLLNGDPYYNRNLSLLREDYGICPFGEDTAMNVLLEVHSSRPDLQRAFPEVGTGNSQRFVDWAATSGVTIDEARRFLRARGSYYVVHASERVKGLACVLDSYNRSIDLQHRFPEVLSGDYERLVSWAGQ